MIIELSDFVITGKINERSIYTDKLLLIKDGWAVTDRGFFKLGNPDKVWITTARAEQLVKEFK